MQLTRSQIKALRAYIDERDAALRGITETFVEAGLDPTQVYQVNWNTGEVTEPVMAAEVPVHELKEIPDGSKSEDNPRVGRRRTRA